MDQLKQVGEFLWKWRFWFALGIVVILAGVVQPVGTAKVQALIQRRTSELNAALGQIQPYTMGDQHPNPKWTEEIKSKEAAAQTEVGKVQESLFNEQSTRMTWWPEEVAKQFDGRPFNSPLDDDKGRYLFIYQQNFAQQVKELMKTVDPITTNRDGTVTGRVVLTDSVIERPQFSEQPSSQAAWLAQEQIWIQRAVLETIRKINESKPEYKDWYSSPIRQVIAIKLGASAVDIRKLAERGGEVALQPPPPVVGEATTVAAATPASGSSQETTGNVTSRYTEFTPEGRSLPISIALLVDQRMLPDVIAGLEQIEFGYILHEVGWNIPTSKINPPVELEDYLNIAPGVSKEAIENTVQLVTFGEMYLRDMPASVRQKWEQERQQKMNPTSAPPADPNAPPADPNAPPADPNAPPADPNAPPADPNAPPVDPNAPPVDPNAPPVDPNAPPADPNAPPAAIEEAPPAGSPPPPAGVPDPM